MKKQQQQPHTPNYLYTTTTTFFEDLSSICEMRKKIHHNKKPNIEKLGPFFSFRMSAIKKDMNVPTTTIIIIITIKLLLLRLYYSITFLITELNLKLIF